MSDQGNEFLYFVPTGGNDDIGLSRNLEAEELHVERDVNIDGNLHVAGNMTLNGDLVISGRIIQADNLERNDGQEKSSGHIQHFDRFRKIRIDW